MRIKLQGTPGSAHSAKDVEITDDDGKPLEKVRRVTIHVAYAELVRADVETLALTEIDMECVRGDLYTRWQGKRYRLVESEEETPQ